MKARLYLYFVMPVDRLPFLTYLLCYTYSTMALAVQALLRAIKDEQGKSRGTRDALQRSMLC